MVDVVSNKWGQEQFGAVEKTIQQAVKSMNTVRSLGGMFSSRPDGAKASDNNSDNNKIFEEICAVWKLIGEATSQVNEIVKMRADDPKPMNVEAAKALNLLELKVFNLAKDFGEHLGINNVTGVMALRNGDVKGFEAKNDAKQLQNQLNKNNIFESAPAILSPVR